MVRTVYAPLQLRPEALSGLRSIATRVALLAPPATALTVQRVRRSGETVLALHFIAVAL